MQVLKCNGQGLSVENQGKALLKASQDGKLATVNALMQVSHTLLMQFTSIYLCVCGCLCTRACQNVCACV